MKQPRGQQKDLGAGRCSILALLVNDQSIGCADHLAPRDRRTVDFFRGINSWPSSRFHWMYRARSVHVTARTLCGGRISSNRTRTGNGIGKTLPPSYCSATMKVLLVDENDVTMTWNPLASGRIFSTKNRDRVYTSLEKHGKDDLRSIGIHLNF